MTTLPFVWAFWVGRPGIVEPVHLEALDAARVAGVGALEAIAAKHAADDEDQAEVARRSGGGRAAGRQRAAGGANVDDNDGL